MSELLTLPYLVDVFGMCVMITYIMRRISISSDYETTGCWSRDWRTDHRKRFSH